MSGTVRSGARHNARRLLAPYVGRYLPQVALAFFCMLLLAAATAGYAFLTGPLLHFLTSGDPASLGPLAALVPGLDPATIDRDRALVLVPGLLVAMGAVRGISYFGQYLLMGATAQNVVRDLREALFARMVAWAPRDLARERTGDLLTRYGADLTAVENGLAIATPAYLRDGVQVVALLALCVHLDWRLSLAAFGVLPLAILPLGRLGKRLQKAARQGQQSVGTLAGLVHETAAGIRVVQAHGMQAHALRRFDRENQRWLAVQRRSLRARGLASPATEFLAVAGIALALGVALQRLGDGALLSSELLSFLATIGLLLQPAKSLGKVGGFFLQGLAAGDRVFEILDRAPSIRDEPGAKPLPPFSEAIRFEQVGLARGERQVLDGFDLELRRGEIVALVGPSGAGKSTVADLLLRLLEPQAGHITLDGRDIRSATLASLRAQIAVVPQDVLLFDDTVRANLAYGRQVSEERLLAALEAAHARDFVEAMPDGLETQIGEGGAALSGGQRQRLAIARALLRDAPILLLDEATSALDAQSEREVQAALEALLTGRTALLIAHRLSTVRFADRICVIDGGRIVEQGSHEDLLEQGGLYRRLFDLQAGERAA